jgi:glutamyl-tRNA synthetase
MPKTRLAPSPTGSLHLGNARTFLVNWALARRRGWRILLRIEDLDGPRVKPEAVDGVRRTLEWLGIDWDEGPVVQSDDLAPYRAAMERLAEAGFAFPCALTRGEIAAAASAPQEGSHELVYPSSLRPESWERRFSHAETNWRFLAAEGSIAFEDAFAGPQSFELSKTIGDFIVWTKRGGPAYQLAVVVDDHRQGITEVVRGDDLLESGARQLALYRALGLTPEPRHWHLPLVVGPDGKRLAKRHGDARLDALRAAGVKAEAVIGVLARWCGIDATGALSAAEFRDALDSAKIPRGPLVFRPEENAKISP